jgi:HD-like signal output (HDOD) protein
MDVMTGIATSSACREKALKSLNDLPPLSPILNRLLGSLANEDVSFAKLASLIEKDTLLAGNILRLVNSSLYGCRGTVNSIGHAISIMGLVKLRNVTLGLSVNNLWAKVRTPKNFSISRFNQHSLAVAVLSDHLVEKVQVAYPEGAFLAGLFHDLGKLLIATALRDEFEMIQGLMYTSGKSREECERELVGCTHSELSALALDRWNLPAPIQATVLYHHHPDEAPRDKDDEFPRHLAHVLCAANDVVNAMGITPFLPARETIPAEDLSALDRLGAAKFAPAMMSEFQAEFEAMRSIS